MSDDYFILLPDGSREGPYAEEELLDFIDAGEIEPATTCLHAASGRMCEAGALFRVIAPVDVSAAPAAAPVAWKPAPFPDAAVQDAPATGHQALRPRLLYRGHRCFLTYWRSALLAVVPVAGGWLGREAAPALFAVGLLAGMSVLLWAVLHRMSALYLITSLRVEAVSGLISKSSRELRIADIRTINVDRRGWTGWLGVGNVTFSGAGTPQEDVRFQRVWRASALKMLVRRMQEVAA